MPGPTEADAVRHQYESYPFPQREPSNELKALYVTGLDGLAKINHYCFSGRQSFDRCFRALVAGGGTGDAAIYLGEQLRSRNAEVVYLDVSATSMAIAQRRAAVRELDNIQWRRGSLLDIDAGELGKFDYINCAGVLHHLADPVAGLKALTAVLKDEGGMGLMVYGLSGRQDIYQAQQLMRLINEGEPDLRRQIDNARRILASLPATNWLLRGRSHAQLLRQFEHDTADLVDTFLHGQDHAFSVDGVYGLLDAVGLELLTFTNFHMAGTVGTRLEYEPGLYVKDAQLLSRMSAMPVRARQAAAELMSGAISLHSFYAARSGDRMASFLDKTKVPFFLTAEGRKHCESLAGSPHEAVTVEIRPGVTLTFNPGQQTRAVIRFIDDKASMADIAAKIDDAPGTGRPMLEEGTVTELEIMTALDWIALRDRSVQPFSMLGQLVESRGLK